MGDLSRQIATQNRCKAIVFWAGLLPLAILVLLWLFWLDLITEALLTPFYCCGLAEPLSPDSWQLRLNDFCASFPGRSLPTVLFFLLGGLIYWFRRKQAANYRWLPLIFAIALFILFGASLLVTELSWWLSNTIVGPHLGGIDAGYHRTWYGLLAHLLLCLGFFTTLAKVRFPGEE